MARDKYKAVLTDEVVEQMNKLSVEEQADIYEAIEELCQDPFAAGTPVIPKDVDKISVCPECGSRNTYTYIDIGCEPHEVAFECCDCGESFWMYENDYYEAREKHPELFVDTVKDPSDRRE